MLLLSTSTLQQLSDLPFKRELASLETKLRALLPQSELSGAQGLLDTIGLQVPTRDQRAPFLEALLQAAQEGRWVKVVYRSSERTSTQHLLPRQIYAQNGLWYCSAYAHEREENRTYRVDRIQSIAPPDVNFAPAPPRDPLPYGHDSHPLVRARLTVKGADLVEADPQIGSNLRRFADGSGELSLRCPPGELAFYTRYFAALGDEVEVLEPEELRERMAALGQKLILRYQKR